MAAPQQSDVVWDALRQLAYEDGERVAVLASLAQAKQRAERDPRLEAVRSEMRAAESALADAARRRRAAESGGEEVRARIKRAEQRLASGALHNEREVGAIQHELDALHALLASHDESWLTSTSDEDAARALSDAQTKKLATEERASATRMVAARNDLADIESRLKAIDELRRDAAAKLPAEMRDRYRTLFPKTGGRPFAQAVAGECSNCHRAVPAAAVQMIRSRSGLPSCPSCARLLLAP